MEQTSVFIKRFLAFLTGPIISTGISFLIVPLITWLVSPSEFGKASMYTLVISLFSLVVFAGIDQAFVREYHETNDKSSLFMNSLFIPLFFSFLASLIVFFSWRFFSLVLFGEEDFFSAIIFVVAFPFTVLERFNLLSIRMEEKARLYSLLTILRQLMRAPLLIVSLYYFRNFHGIILAEAGAQIILPFFSGYAARKSWKLFFSLDRKLIKDLLRFGLPLLPATILMWLFNGMATMSLRYWSTFEEIGIYSSAFKLISVLNIFNGAFSLFWVPTAYRWYKEGIDSRKFERVGNMLCLFMTFVGFVIISSRELVVLLLSPEYGKSASVMPFLVFIPVMYSVSEVTVLGINFSKRTEYHIIVSFLCLIANSVSNYSLVSRFGAKGAAISMGIGYIVFFWARTFFAYRAWKKFKISEYAINISLLVLYAMSTEFDSFQLLFQGIIFFVWGVLNRYFLLKFLIFGFTLVQNKFLRKLKAP